MADLPAIATASSALKNTNCSNATAGTFESVFDVLYWGRDDTYPFGFLMWNLIVALMAMAPLRASMEIFDEVGMARLREKSVRLTSTLEGLIDDIGSSMIEIVTPRDVAARGCQLSLLVHRDGRAFQQSLIKAGVICDFREPNVVRVAPTPLYNTFHETWKFAQILREHVS